MFRKYNSGFDNLNVAYAVVAGILKPEEMPPALLEALAKEISMYQEMKDMGELLLPREEV